MDKCREEFESYLLNNGYSKDALHKSQYCDYYSRSFTRELWKAWQKAWLASRESMKAIKLPKHSNPLKDKTIMFISDVKTLLESAGINVEIEE